MKWYKKQLDQLKSTKSKSTEAGKKETIKAPLVDTFKTQKLMAKKPSFTSPVAKRNINRPKTDSI